MSGPLSSPWERGPDLTPRPLSPRGRGQHFYSELWLLGEPKAVVVNKFLLDCCDEATWPLGARD
jgi:hypothetical protein